MSAGIEGERPQGELTSQQAKSEQALAQGNRESTLMQPERRTPPNVWDVLELRERLTELKPKRHWVYSDSRIKSPLPEKLECEERELNRLSRELREKGIPRDRLILELGSYGRLRTRGLSQQEDFQQFRSQVEQMTDEEIAKEIRRQKEMRKPAFHPGVGLGEIMKKLKDQKGKQEQNS